MTDLFRFALLGLGTGGIYALLGLGLVVIYRGSGVINFAQSGFALVGAYLTYRFHVEDGHGTVRLLVGAADRLLRRARRGGALAGDAAAAHGQPAGPGDRDAGRPHRARRKRWSSSSAPSR